MTTLLIPIAANPPDAPNAIIYMRNLNILKADYQLHLVKLYKALEDCCNVNGGNCDWCKYRQLCVSLFDGIIDKFHM